MKHNFVAYCFAGLVAASGFGALAQSGAPPLRVVPMGEKERPATPVKKKPVVKAPLKTAAAKPVVKKASAPVSSAPKQAVAQATSPKAPVAKPPVTKVAPPKITPVRDATPASPAPKPAPAASTSATAADWRPLDPENAILYETSKGNIIVELAPDLAPGHVARIKELAREGFYNGLAFHRVIDGFMAQGGDPKGDGTGGSDKPDLRSEFNFRRGSDTSFVRAIERGGAILGFVRTLPVTSQPDALMERTADKRVAAWANHCPGVGSMARSDDENSANSQFFLMRSSYPTLDRRYTIWGRAVIGLDVIRALKVGEPVPEPDRMINVRVLVDVPEAERPKVMIQRTDSPSFKARLATALEERGAAFSNCDITPEARIVP
ncbi:MAG: hypothetical protein RL186_1394 [Pseudomonadota bacterium]